MKVKEDPTKQCAGSLFVRVQTKQLFTLLFYFVELHSQLILLTMNS